MHIIVKVFGYSRRVSLTVGADGYQDVLHVGNNSGIHGVHIVNFTGNAQVPGIIVSQLCCRL